MICRPYLKYEVVESTLQIHRGYTPYSNYLLENKHLLPRLKENII